MRVLDKIFRVLGYQRMPKGRRGIRAYQAAKVNRLNADWRPGSTSADHDIYHALVTVRDRARDLAQNNDYARRYLNMMKQNVVGPTGITFQSNVLDGDEYLRQVNEEVERKWSKFCRKENFTINGTMNAKEVALLLLETVLRDGEALVRFLPVNKNHGVTLQVIEPDMLDEQLNRDLGDGNYIRMGIEYDEWQRPQAYYFKKIDKRYDLYYSGYSAEHVRIDAKDILHLYIKERAGQSRGISIMASSMSRLQMLSGFEEASLVNARVSASKMGFYTSNSGIEAAADQDEQGNLIYEADPGVFEQLPPGVSFVAFDPKFPHEQHGPFMKSTLKGVAAGMNVSYTSLSNSLEEVNYSSIRAGILDERDHFKLIQEWFIDNFFQPVFERWIESAYLGGALNIPASMIDRVIENAAFYGRRWDWVDPLKDALAAEKSIQLGLKSIQEYHAERGTDIYEVFNQIKQAKELAEKLGIKIGKEENGYQSNDREEAEQNSDDSAGERSARRQDGRIIYQL